MTRLDEITAEMSQCDRQERIDLLLDFAKGLPPLPDRLAAHKDAAHRVEECQSPVYLFVELEARRSGSSPTPRSRPRRCAGSSRCCSRG